MVATELLIAFCVAFHVMRCRAREQSKKDRKSLSLSWLADDANIEISGAALEQGYWWVLATATFDHADMRHLINNMLHLACIGFSLEVVWGSLRLGCGFLLTGACGWLCNLTLLRMHCRGELWSLGAKYQSSTGSSPATYGLTAVLVLLAPEACTCEGIDLVPPWLWLASLVLLPHVAIYVPAYNIQWWRVERGDAVGLQLNPRCFAFLLVGAGLSKALTVLMLRPTPDSSPANCAARGAPPSSKLALCLPVPAENGVLESPAARHLRASHHRAAVLARAGTGDGRPTLFVPWQCWSR